jgi:MSHA biogenesis protein MshQ
VPQLTFIRDLDFQDWHHYALTFKTGEQKAYLDGMEVDSLFVPGELRTNNLELTIGNAVDRGYFFDGAIDEVMIFDRALSADEIETIFGAVNIPVD